MDDQWLLNRFGWWLMLFPFLYGGAVFTWWWFWLDYWPNRTDKERE